MKKLKQTSGLTLLSLALTMALFGTSLFAYLKAQANLRRVYRTVQNRAIAETYSAELAEFFRSMSRPAAEEFLRERGSFKYCEQVNLLDRNTKAIANPDPIADLPPSPLDRGSQIEFNANRWYRIQIVEQVTLKPVEEFCQHKIGDKPLGVGQAFLVSVGIDYFDEGEEKYFVPGAKIPPLDTPSSGQSVGPCYRTGWSNGADGPIYRRIVLPVLLLDDLSTDYKAIDLGRDFGGTKWGNAI